MLKAISRNVFPFRFRCVRCGTCCTTLSAGAPLYSHEVDAIAGHLGEQRSAFLRSHCSVVSYRVRSGRRNIRVPVLRLKVRKGVCILFDREHAACRIHACKPYQCKAAPFIALLFQDKRAIKALKDKCAGFGSGALHGSEEIMARLHEETALEEEDWSVYQTRMSGKSAELNGQGGDDNGSRSE